MTRPRVGLIWAESIGHVIGFRNELPWRLPEDLQHFKDVTAGSTVVMGRKTWESLPARSRPLPGRRNIVVTRQEGWATDGALAATSVADALALAADVDVVWVIGGSQLFSSVIDLADQLEVTRIRGRFSGDTYAPLVSELWTPTTDTDWLTAASGLEYRFTHYTRAER